MTPSKCPWHSHRAISSKLSNSDRIMGISFSLCFSVFYIDPVLQESWRKNFFSPTYISTAIFIECWGLILHHTELRYNRMVRNCDLSVLTSNASSRSTKLYIFKEFYSWEVLKTLWVQQTMEFCIIPRTTQCLDFWRDMKQ